MRLDAGCRGRCTYGPTAANGSSNNAAETATDSPGTERHRSGGRSRQGGRVVAAVPDDVPLGLAGRLDAHVAAARGLPVVLFGEHRPGQAQDRRPVGEDADDWFRRQISFSTAPAGYFRRFGQCSVRNAVKARISSFAAASLQLGARSPREIGVQARLRPARGAPRGRASGWSETGRACRPARPQCWALGKQVRRVRVRRRRQMMCLVEDTRWPTSASGSRPGPSCTTPVAVSSCCTCVASVTSARFHHTLRN
jgi:hypothetical protein